MCFYFYLFIVSVRVVCIGDVVGVSAVAQILGRWKQQQQYSSIGWVEVLLVATKAVALEAKAVGLVALAPQQLVLLAPVAPEVLWRLKLWQ